MDSTCSMLPSALPSHQDSNSPQQQKQTMAEHRNTRESRPNQRTNQPPDQQLNKRVLQAEGSNTNRRGVQRSRSNPSKKVVRFESARERKVRGRNLLLKEILRKLEAATAAVESSKQAEHRIQREGGETTTVPVGYTALLQDNTVCKATEVPTNMSSLSGSLFSSPTVCGVGVRSRTVMYEEVSERENQWLSKILQHRQISPQELQDTQVSVVDILSDGSARNLGASAFKVKMSIPEQLAMVENEREKDTRARIVYVGIEHEDTFNTKTIEALPVGRNFLLDHFLPSLRCDQKIKYDGEELSRIAPLPSEHQYFRLKDCKGRNISAQFLENIPSMERTVHILGPIKCSRGFEWYKKALVVRFNECRAPVASFNKGRRPQEVYNGSEYIYPIVQQVALDFAELLQAAQIERSNTHQLKAYYTELDDAQQRLQFCLHNILVLGDKRNPQTSELKGDFEYLLSQANQLKQQAKEWQDRMTADENLATAIESNKEALASRRLAESAWRLTILAFAFIPLNFVSSAFAMHLTALGFSDGLELWKFFAAAVPVEVSVVVIALAFGPFLRFLRRVKGACKF